MSHDQSSTDPTESEQQRVDDLPDGSGADSDGQEDTASGGAPEQPDA